MPLKLIKMEEHNYKPLPKEAIEFNEEFPTSKHKITKTQIAIVSLSLLLIISLGYIFTELPEQEIEVVRNESLMIGFNSGIEYWNKIVIDNWNDNNRVVWYVNGTFTGLTKSQICGVTND